MGYQIKNLLFYEENEEEVNELVEQYMDAGWELLKDKHFIATIDNKDIFCKDIRIWRD